MEGLSKLEHQKAAVLEMQRRLKEERRALEHRQAEQEQAAAQRIAQLAEENARLARELESAQLGLPVTHPRPTSRSSLHSGGHLDAPRPPPPSGSPIDLPPPVVVAPALNRDPLPPITAAKVPQHHHMRSAAQILEEIQALTAQVQRGSADALVLARITELEHQLNEPATTAVATGPSPLPPPSHFAPPSPVQMSPFAAAAAGPLVAPGYSGMYPTPALGPPAAPYGMMGMVRLTHRYTI